MGAVCCKSQDTSIEDYSDVQNGEFSKAISNTEVSKDFVFEHDEVYQKVYNEQKERIVQENLEYTTLFVFKTEKEETRYKGYLNQKKERHGPGSELWENGSFYHGSYLNDIVFSYGLLHHSDGATYLGQWANGQSNGYGIYTHPHGAKYVGFWHNDRQHGRGLETWPDGAVFKGVYKNGKKHGIGKFKWADESQYEGEFEDNNISGHMARKLNAWQRSLHLG
eukprot:403349040